MADPAIDRGEGVLQCPSATPELPGSRILGVVRRGDAHQPDIAPRVEYLSELHPASPEILALAGSAAPTEVFRFAAPCATHACQHYDGHQCSLARRIVSRLPVIENELPSCAIRPACRWFREQGPEACFRCAWIVTDTADLGETSAAFEALRAVAAPPEPLT
jgi:hypothetical protein